MATPPGAPAGVFRALLVAAGEHVCAIPVTQVRRVVRALPVHPLPGAASELLGLAEFAGEPIPVLDLGRLVNAPPGARPSAPVTVIAWAGPPSSRELVGLSADAALEIVEIAPAEIAFSGTNSLCGEATVAGRPVRVLNLETLGSR